MADNKHGERLEEIREQIAAAFASVPLSIYDEVTKPAERAFGDLLSALEAAEADARQKAYEAKCWRRMFKIGDDVKLMLPSDQPPPPEAIELGRKLLAYYRPDALGRA